MPALLFSLLLSLLFLRNIRALGTARGSITKTPGSDILRDTGLSLIYLGELSFTRAGAKPGSATRLGSH